MILDEAKSVRVRLERANAARAGVEEAAALSKRADELKKLAEKVEVLSRRRSMLRVGGVQLPAAIDTESAKKLCTQIVSRFVESPKAATLAEKQRWTKLSETLNEFCVAEETQQKINWKDYYARKLFGGVSPEQRKQTILMTLPENQRAWERYKRLYARFSEYRNNFPATADELAAVQEWSKELSEIRFIENEDIPPAVREFFIATATGSGANLDLLTPEVITWLRSNDMLKNFSVRAR
ncbi:hypothetical protein GWQ43_05575 [Alcaligenes faecalis]|uniref:protein DpdI n=1 Tax=Alcaligenes faecalis TaxID=511 RepID=UPI00137BE01B|nr:protein DpdI [Alcaligenes faecalis]QHS35578.1 hypothetical protein GWQ43_05575 [Alcaligenes faecalis]